MTINCVWRQLVFVGLIQVRNKLHFFHSLAKVKLGIVWLTLKGKWKSLKKRMRHFREIKQCAERITLWMCSQPDAHLWILVYTFISSHEYCLFWSLNIFQYQPMFYGIHYLHQDSFQLIVFCFYKITPFWAAKMAQLIKVLAVKPDDLKSVLCSHMVDRAPGPLSCPFTPTSALWCGHSRKGK